MSCACVNTEVRARKIRGGAVQHVRQCVDCGEPVGGPQKQIGDVPPFDESLVQCLRDEQARLRNEKFEQESARMKAQYADYLASTEWRELAGRVLMRDDYTCQGCLKEPAAVVHHQTYAHVGAEFAFELISLCKRCHARAHELVATTPTPKHLAKGEKA